MVCHGFTDKSSVCFRSLKSLNLTFVSFLDQESFCMLMSACPVLDDLFWDSVAIRLSSLFPACDSLFTISIPSLERLEIKDYTPVQSHQSHESRFKINAPSLKYLKINYNSFGRFEISSAMPNLVEATLRVDPSQTDKPLIFLTPVKFLSIHLYVTEVLLLADKISQRLLRLELCIYGKISRNLLLHLLKHSPKLQVLKLREIRYSTQVLNKSPRVLEFKDPPLSFPDPSSVPECLSFHLTTFEWRCYRGTEEEKEFIIYILQNAACLKTAVISVYSEGRRFGEKELLWIKELESVPKASTSCQLVIRLTSRVNLPRISVVDLPRKLHFM
ncbi:putative F-box/FBD/LRR-repeat protein [Raphanus sativus]|nr:putative F-box/FBD/LRR-repeat protein [Raphanus sativus]